MEESPPKRQKMDPVESFRSLDFDEFEEELDRRRRTLTNDDHEDMLLDLEDEVSILQDLIYKAKEQALPKVYGELIFRVVDDRFIRVDAFEDQAPYKRSELQWHWFADWSEQVESDDYLGLHKIKHFLTTEDVLLKSVQVLRKII